MLSKYLKFISFHTHDPLRSTSATSEVTEVTVASEVIVVKNDKKSESRGFITA